jgi:hypothetical protein
MISSSHAGTGTKKHAAQVLLKKTAPQNYRNDPIEKTL